MGARGIGPGDRVGNLEIRREVGRGAFGIVFEAHDALLDRAVALKVFHPHRAAGDDIERRRALAEARLTGRLNSPHVVTLFSVHLLPEDALGFEMEFVQGGSLEARLREGPPLTLDEAMRITRHLATGLEAVHEAGIIHGDIKPANVLLDVAGRAKLADFGLGRPLPDATLSSSMHAPAGTPEYMAPEVVMGSGTTLASDMWSLGVVVYRLLARRMPYLYTNLYELFAAIQNTEPAPLPSTVPTALADFTLRCLAKDAVARPTDLQALVHATHEIPQAAVHAKAPRRDVSLPQPVHMVGRRAERGRLSVLLDRLIDEGRGGGVLIAGDAGIGKTTLVRTLADDAARRGCLHVETAISPLFGLLRPLLETLRAVRAGSSSQGPLESRAQMLWDIEQLVEKLTSTKPLLLVIEGAHRAESEDLRLLAGLAARLRSTRTLLLVTYRLRHPTHGSSGSTDASGYRELVAREALEVLILEGLSPEPMLVLLQRTGRAPLHQRVAREILHSADGNAFFAIEMLRDLLDSGAVVDRDHELVPGPDWPARRIPQRVRDLVARRFLRLTEKQRDLLDVAAVDGTGFDGEAVAAVLDQPLLEVLRGLQRLYREHALIAPRRNGYTFAHPLIQEVLYDETAPALRRTIHRSLAEHLGARAASTPVDPERVGTHWERAGDRERAAPLLRQAAAAAYERMEIGRALDLFRRSGWEAAGFGDAEIRDDPEAALHYAVCLADGGHYDQAAGVFDAIADFARGAADRNLELRAACKRSKSLFHARGVKALAIAELEHATRELDDPRDLGLAWYALGLAARSKGDRERARALLVEAERCYRDAHWDAGLSDVLDVQATMASNDGDLERATDLYAEAARLAERAGRRVNAAISDVNSVLASFHRGRMDGLEERLHHAIAVCDLHGSTAAAHARLVLAHVLIALGRMQEARGQVQQARRQSHETGFTVGAIYAGIADAQLALMADEPDQAEAALTHAMELADSVGFARARVMSLATRLELLCLGSRREEAADLLEGELEALLGQPPSVRSGLLAGLSELVLLGLPPAALEDGRLLEGVDEATSTLVAAARAWCWRDGGASELERAARTIEDDETGDRRAIRRVVALRWRAEARRRAGDLPEAREEARRALEGARGLGYGAHVRAIETWLANLPAS